jgi:hypothetical protein
LTEIKNNVGFTRLESEQTSGQKTELFEHFNIIFNFINDLAGTADFVHVNPT